MALKQLMLAKKIEQRKSLLEELNQKGEELVKRSADLEAALEEASTDEEVATVEEEINKFDTDKEAHDGKKKELEEEISKLEGELEGLNSKEPKNDEGQRSASPDSQQPNRVQEGETRMKVNKFETRSQMLERLNRPEVREFYSKVSEAALNKRALSDTNLIIPEVVIDMIQSRLGDYSALYREVTVQQLNGTARIIMDGAIPEAIWTEMCDPVQELATSFSQTELDGFKVGGFIPVCNAVLEDSMINLANFIEGRLSMAIAKAIDKAILVGAGAASKQPQGVITALNGITAQNVESDFTLADIVGKMSIIDDGDDGVPVGEVIAVMKRSTYYAELAPQTFLSTSDGRLVVQTAQSPRLPDGTRVVFSQYAPADTIVLGDFKKYLLGERKGVQLAVSTDVRFIQDETVFKGTARYDGKPIYNEYFVVITKAAAGA
ncbi:phage major capsid protein [Sutcliffiella horikoshii]|uniref:Phage major capsid protein n=1 Tax=Sutcliffiella horikoshii TaxID=79883 RepID=A0A5D4T130_9BACI|nr:phage major capsid protein [Sutcliffiella horikoshii]TYS68661.1 phage major capsid protein [Sutcliffiella horikoshii]